MATLFKVLQASNCLDQSPLLSYSNAVLYCFSGLIRGSSIG